MEDPGKQPPDFAATEFSAEIRAHVKNHSCVLRIIPKQTREEWGVHKANVPPAGISLCINPHIVVGHMHFA